MSDISSLYTPQTGNNAALSASEKSAGALAAATPGTPGGFLDMLMAALLPAMPVETVTPAAPAADASANTPAAGLQAIYTPVTDAQPPLALSSADETKDADTTDALAALMPVTQIVENIVAIQKPAASLAPALAKGQKQNPVQSGLDTRLQAQITAATDEAPITDPAQLNALIVGGDQTETAGDESKFDLLQTLPSATSEPTNEVAKQLNALSVGAQDTKNNGSKGGSPADLLKGLTLVPANDTGYQPVLSGTGAPSQGGAVPVSPITSALIPERSEMIDQMSADSDSPILNVEVTLFDPDLTSPAAGTSPAAPTLAAHGMSTALGATAGTNGHAAVQAVALHLQQLAQNRDTRSLTLQLNPPELGKMQIKMTYGRDKTVKADLLIEKADTFNLMKNDADALKDVLNNAGLQADANSLSFSLADHGTFTHQNESGEAFNTGSGSKEADGSESDVIGAIEIKSSEEWSVDPRTGIVRYNIVV